MSLSRNCKLRKSMASLLDFQLFPKPYLQLNFGIFWMRSFKSKISQCVLKNLRISHSTYYTWDFKEIAICGKAWPCPSAPHLHEERQRRGKVFADTMGPKTFGKSLNLGRLHWIMAGKVHTLDSWINNGVCLLNFGFFSRSYVFIKESNP